MALVDTTQESIFVQLSEHVDGELPRSSPDFALRVQNPTLEGFCIQANSTPVFYLTARVDDTVPDAVSGADQLYIWSDGTFTCYGQYAVTALTPLVPSGETDPMPQPL